MDQLESRKELIKSNAEVKYEKLGSKKSYADIVIHRNKKRHNIRKEISQYHTIHNDNVRPNLYSSNDDSNAWSHRKPFDM